MAAGTAILGGIVAIPALAVMALLNHLSANKQIKQLSEIMLKIREAISDQKECELRVDLIGRRSDELRISLIKARQAFLHEYRKTYISIYPFFFFSKLLKYLKKKLFGKDYFSSKDLEKIRTLLDVPMNSGN